ncbi:MAG: transcriptional regulator [Bacteroidetes bacterium]|nr:MAG: transcriptional regulator [Bacteroidota bacterium]PIE88233.1 MAG: transcriptional regulator [Bacteroidota bacterium]
MNKPTLDIEKLEAAASKLRAMAHPMRLAIIELLQNGNKMNVTQIYQKLHMEQATASHHLNVLKNKKLLISFRKGKHIYYTLQNDTLQEIMHCIDRCHKLEQ